MKNIEEKYLQHEEKIVVAVGDTDFNEHIKPSAIMGYCQDIATKHADSLGFGYADLFKLNLAWIMIRMSFKVFKNPKINETLLIKTFCEKPKTLDVNRSYYIYNADGEIVVSASSKWCVIDIDTQKVSRLATLFEKYNDSLYIPTEPFDDANPKIQAAPDITHAAELPAFMVQVTDLDRNFHMNNARYGDIILNACGVETLKENILTRVDLNFISQLFVGDKYEVYKSKKDNFIFVEAKKSGSDTVIFRARTEWQSCD